MNVRRTRSPGRRLALAGADGASAHFRRLRRRRGESVRHLSAVLPMAAVAAGFFRRVQCLVCAADQPGDVVARFELRDAQAASDFERLALATVDGCFDRRPNSLGHFAGAGRVGGGQNDAELFAAVAARQVHVAALRLEHLGHLAQHFVAHLVAVRVVEFLEEVDIQQHERARRCVCVPIR